MKITEDDERIGSLPTIEFADSDEISVGQPVMAIGNALGEYANTTTAGQSAFDGLINGLGYSFILLLISVFRELTGMGTLLGYAMPYFSGPYWDKWTIMVMPPGAFFMLAVVIWIFRTINLPKEKKNG
jgi:Na+-transporting NADH:ubiquinone oxidoreductase subunit NqrD